MQAAGYAIGTYIRPADGFAEGGDTLVVREIDGVLLLAVADVLGHGPAARREAALIESLLGDTASTDVVRLLEMLDKELSGGLGAAIGLARIDPAEGIARYAAIGNVVARLVGPRRRTLLSVDGVVGQGRHTPRPVEFTMDVNDVLLMHTDGVSSRFDVDEYPQLPSEDVVTAAREVVRRFGRDHDDAACLAARRDHV